MIGAIIPDRFKKQFAEQTTAGRVKSTNNPNYVDVRRPTRGIQLKDDTFATLKVVMGDGTSIPLVNASARNPVEWQGKKASSLYSNFLIQQVQEARIEKQQIVETFGESFIFFFGERPRIINVQGVLLNTFDFNWEAEWWFNYDEFLRGTKCVERDARIFLTFDETLVAGYIMSAESTKQAQERNYVPVTFQMFVTDYTTLSQLGDNSADQSKTPPVDSFNVAAYRPMTIPFAGFSAVGGESSMSLAQALGGGINAVQQVWENAQMLAANALVTAGMFLGNVVRVPYGFAGALAFDENEVVLSEDAGMGLTTGVRYTTFNKNDDEYIGATPFIGGSNAYNDSDTDLFGKIDNFLTFGGGNDMILAEEQVVTAVEEWAQNGLIVPPPVVNGVVALARQTGIGMQVLGAGERLLAQATIAKDIGFGYAAPAVAGFQNLMGGAALADIAVRTTVGSVDRVGSLAAMSVSGGSPLATSIERAAQNGWQIAGQPNPGVDAYKSVIIGGG